VPLQQLEHLGGEPLERIGGNGTDRAGAGEDEGYDLHPRPVARGQEAGRGRVRAPVVSDDLLAAQNPKSLELVVVGRYAGEGVGLV
jgi:hypothetical protein